MENYNKAAEQKLIEIAKEKEQADKRLLFLEIIICISVSLTMFALIMVAAFVSMPNWARIVLIAVGVIPFAIGICYAIRIEQVAGYYQCSKCGHKYVPKYGSVLWSMHFNRTRYMRCPECHKKSWQKKVLDRE